MSYSLRCAWCDARMPDKAALIQHEREEHGEEMETPTDTYYDGDTGGQITPPATSSVYGYCPRCGAPGVMRERRPNGNDRCEEGHTYPSAQALPAPKWAKHDAMFGKPVETAPLRLPPQLLEDRPMLFTIPGQPNVFTAKYGEMVEFHRALGQELARMMRDRGSSRALPEDPDDGGTPAAIQEAA
jgi:hypothetical protein